MLEINYTLATLQFQNFGGTDKNFIALDFYLISFLFNFIRIRKAGNPGVNLSKRNDTLKEILSRILHLDLFLLIQWSSFKVE